MMNDESSSHQSSLNSSFIIHRSLFLEIRVRVLFD